MIYLSKQKILFLKPQKVAGTSFEIALSRFAGPNDIITPISEEDEITRQERGYPSCQNYQEPFQDVLKSKRKAVQFIYRRKRATLFYNHISAALARERLGAKHFDEAYKVSIVRNPFDYLISMYFWKNRNNSDALSFVDWVAKNPTLINSNNEQYFIGGKMVIDFFIRYESASQDIAELERNFPEIVGLSKEFSSLSAKGGTRPKASTTSEIFKDKQQLIESVRFFNGQIFDKFGYDYV